MSGGAVAGPDGLLRCPWALSAPEYLDYHDREWGQPVRTVHGLYERMTLEAFQSGPVLDHHPAQAGELPRSLRRLRPRAGRALRPERCRTADGRCGHRPQSGQDRSRDQQRAGGHRAGEEFAGLILRHQVTDRPRPTAEDWRATSPESVAMAKELKRRGIRFFGPTTAYALMQAVGLVDDHLADCFVPPVEQRRLVREDEASGSGSHRWSFPLDSCRRYFRLAPHGTRRGRGLAIRNNCACTCRKNYR